MRDHIKVVAGRQRSISIKTVEAKLSKNPAEPAPQPATRSSPRSHTPLRVNH